MTTNNCRARFVFVTGHDFGNVALKALLDSPHYGEHITCDLLVALHPDKIDVTTGYVDASSLAAQRHIQTEYVTSIKSDHAVEAISKAQPDYLLVIGWSELVPARLLDVPMIKHKATQRHSASFGCLGMHPSLLPQGRGRAPIPWAILRGLKETGVTSFLLEDGADTGGIVGQIKIPITDIETATSLFNKARQAHADLARALAVMMATRSLKANHQDENLATVWRKRTPEDGRIDFHCRAADVDRLVRALTPPYPGAFFLYHGHKVIVDEVRLLPDPVGPAGTILAVTPDGRPLIATPDASIEVKVIRSGSVTFTPGDLVE